jgi:hypothetical protein
MPQEWSCARPSSPRRAAGSRKPSIRETTPSSQRAARALTGRDQSGEHRPVRLLRQGRTQRPAEQGGRSWTGSTWFSWPRTCSPKSANGDRECQGRRGRAAGTNHPNATSPNATSSAPGWTASTNTAPRLTRPRPPAWQAPSRLEAGDQSGHPHRILDRTIQGLQPPSPQHHGCNAFEFRNRVS